MKHVLLKVRPRKVAWILKENDWGLIEEVIGYNCNVEGGYYNIMICLNNNLELEEVDRVFLESYDADIVVLPPNVSKNSFKSELDKLDKIINPFRIIEWTEKSEYIYSSSSAIGGEENIRVREGILGEKSKPLENSIIAVSLKNNIYNRLALVACGDIQNEEIFDCQVYEQLEQNIGYRRSFLRKFICEKEIVTDNILNREELYDKLSQVNRFPLDNPIKAIDTCLKLQNVPCNRLSFCNLTKTYHSRYINHNREDEFILLVSDNLDVNDATRFWNLRASERFVAWCTFDDINKDIMKFIEYFRGVLSFDERNIDLGIPFILKGKKIVLSSSRKNKERLEEIVIKINQQVKNMATIKYYDEFNKFDFEVPYLEKLNGLSIGNRIKLDCDSSSEYDGTYVIEIESSNKKFPYNKNIEQYLSDYEVDIRIGKSNNILIEASEMIDEIKINDIKLETIFNEIFELAGYGKLRISSAGKYQKEYIKLAGSFQNAIKYLVEYPYKTILEKFSKDKKEKGHQSGWWISSLNRYVYNIFELYSLLKIDKPNNFEELYKKIDEIPPEVKELHEKSILERGFLLTCKECGYNYWYSIKNVGEDFICSRCENKQIYQPFTLECIKLKEVVVQGMNTHMEVPLLAINYLNNNKRVSFEWIYDSDFIKSNRNLDILCNIDGKIYVGEAKSLDNIENEQFNYYEELIINAKIDGIIFATSKEKWSTHTTNKIESLKNKFKGDIIVLTSNELYSDKKASKIY